MTASDGLVADGAAVASDMIEPDPGARPFGQVGYRGVVEAFKGGFAAALGAGRLGMGTSIGGSERVSGGGATRRRKGP